MNRAKRRAAERKMREASIRHAQPQQLEQPAAIAETPAEPVAAPQPKPEISAARLAANRSNALLSTGPSLASRPKVSLNALKHGLTGRSILLPSEDADRYQAALEGFAAEFQPVGIVEIHHVQALVDIAWRLDRIPAFEYALLVSGRRRLQEGYPKETAKMDLIELDLEVRQLSEKAFRNLQLQEHRLLRRRDKELKELRALQAARHAKELQELERAAKAALLAKVETQPLEDFTQRGFVFSNPKINEYLNQLTAEARQNLIKEVHTLRDQNAAAMQNAA